MLKNVYRSSCTVPFIGLHVQYPLLVFMYSTLYWSSRTVPFIGLHVQCPLLVFMFSTLYWSSRTVPFIGLHVQYPSLVFTYSTLYWSSCTVSFVLVRFQWTWIFLEKFSKNPQISNCMKILPVEAELYHEFKTFRNIPKPAFWFCSPLNAPSFRSADTIGLCVLIPPIPFCLNSALYN